MAQEPQRQVSMPKLTIDADALLDLRAVQMDAVRAINVVIDDIDEHAMTPRERRYYRALVAAMMQLDASTRRVVERYHPNGNGHKEG